MIDLGKVNLLGIEVCAVDYEAAVGKIIQAAQQRQPLGVSALAVHGVMTGVTDREHCYRLNQLELVVPDGQPVRWAMNALHGTKLPDRVYGPNLMLKVCQAAAENNLRLFLFGSNSQTLDKLEDQLTAKYPNLSIVGKRPSMFRRLNEAESISLVNDIKGSGADITMVGIGCPRQEVWAFEFKNQLSMPVLAVGAAFAFHAGELAQAPAWMQDRGLEWLYRFTREPARLWKRYVLLNPAYLSLLALQATRLLTLKPSRGQPPRNQMLYG
ncbi:MAG: WecB/TagA/CpsF family glycosyltransferase [Pirellulaceae bacterium]|nr:WecB/TagA/CpsF family glycosyltransferase [Pirellulaceae bacterium]